MRARERRMERCRRMLDERRAQSEEKPPKISKSAPKGKECSFVRTYIFHTSTSVQCSEF